MDDTMDEQSTSQKPQSIEYAITQGFLLDIAGQQTFLADDLAVATYQLLGEILKERGLIG